LWLKLTNMSATIGLWDWRVHWRRASFKDCVEKDGHQRTQQPVTSNRPSVLLHYNLTSHLSHRIMSLGPLFLKDP
jgi:hypothetical protein